MYWSSRSAATKYQFARYKHNIKISLFWLVLNSMHFWRCHIILWENIELPNFTKNASIRLEKQNVQSILFN